MNQITVVRPIYQSQFPVSVSIVYNLNADTFGDIFNSLSETKSNFRSESFTQSELTQIKESYDGYKAYFDTNLEKLKALKTKIETDEAKHGTETEPEKKTALYAKIEKQKAVYQKMRAVLEPLAEQIKAMQATLESKRKNRPRRDLINISMGAVSVLKRRKDGVYEVVYIQDS